MAGFFGTIFSAEAFFVAAFEVILFDAFRETFFASALATA